MDDQPLKMSQNVSLNRRGWASQKTKTPDEGKAAAIKRLAERVGADTVSTWQQQWIAAEGHEDQKDSLALAMLAVWPSISNATMRAVLQGLGGSRLARWPRTCGRKNDGAHRQQSLR